MIWLSVITIFSLYTLGIDAAIKPIEPLRRPMWLLAKTKLEISCTTTDTSSNVDWFHDGTKVISNPPRVSITLTQAGTEAVSTLTVGDLRVDDAGLYSCQATGGDKQEVDVKILKVTPMDATYKVGQNATIGVHVNNLSDEQRKANLTSIKWYKNGTDKITPDGAAIVLDTKSNTITLTKPTRKDIGKYVCEFTFSVKNDGKPGHTFLRQPVYINAKPTIKVNYKSKNLVEGDILMLECEASGYPTPDISWFKEGDLLIAGNRTSIKDLSKEDKYGSVFVKDGLLVIDDLTFDDRADYMCEASNVLGNYNYTITLRVKDKLAALWPFMAIVCEVVILCIIIFIYEKKKGKELDQQAAHLNGKHAEYGEIPRDKKPSKEDVRLRKS